MAPVSVRLRVLPALLPKDGREIELRVTSDFIQWRYVTDQNGEYAWQDLIAIAELIGPEGPSVELRSDGTSIQYRSVGGDVWLDIVPLTDLTGAQGAPGENGEPGAPGAPGQGVPPGGSTGQVLAKTSGVDYATAWQTLAAVSPRVFTKPAAFEWPGKATNQVNNRPMLVRRDVGGKFTLDFALWSPPPVISGATRKRYYVASGGNSSDSNTGLTEQDALRSMDAALAKADAYNIVVAPGTYAGLWTSTAPAATQCTISVANGGRAQFLVGTNVHTWTVTGTAGVYSITGVTGTVTALVTTFFYDAFGNLLRLRKAANLAALNAGTVGWFSSAGTVYVRLPDSSAPVASSIYVLKGDAGPTIAVGSRYYMRGLEFYGGAAGAFVIDGAAGTNFAFEDCAFHASEADGLAANNTYGGAILKNCVAAQNVADGFNYHDVSSSTPCIAVEMDCIGVNNGFDSVTNINNGSTIHNNGRIVRVNGLYGAGTGPSIADVGSSMSWNVGCLGFGSVNGTAASFQCGLDSDPGGATTMWLDSCASYGSTKDIYVGRVTAHSVFTRDLTSAGVIDVVAPGTVTPY